MEFIASHHQTSQKREASEAFATEYENPIRRTEAPQSTGIHNQRFVANTPIDQSYPVLPTLSASAAMENIFTSEQGQQATAESTHIRSPPTVEQLAEFAASHRQTKQKRGASEAFATEYKAPVRRIEAVHNQRFVAITSIDQGHPALPSFSASNQESSTSNAGPTNHDDISPLTSTLDNNADLRKQLREEINKEVELLYDSRLAKSTADLEAFWRASGRKEPRRWKLLETEVNRSFVQGQRRDYEGALRRDRKPQGKT